MGVTVIEKDGGSGSTAWGDITGTLSNQTDLQTALDNAGGGFWDDTVTQSADQTVTNSATLVDSDDLQVTLDASSTYLIEVLMVLDDDDNSGGSAAGVKFGFTYTGTSSSTAYNQPEIKAVGLVDRNFLNEFSSPFSPSSSYGFVEGSTFVTTAYINTTTSGDIKLQFAQKNANASDTAYLRKGSAMFIKKVS